MSDTPETDEQEEMDNGDTVPLLDFARNLERQRNDALQLTRELRDILEAVMPFIGATDAPEWACGDSYVIIRKADKLLCN